MIENKLSPPKQEESISANLGLLTREEEKRDQFP